MTALAVSRSISNGSNPTEAQFDTMRTDLLNFFNTTSLDVNNLATGGMLYTSLSGLGDDEALKFTSDDFTFKYVNGTDKFEVRNTEGNVIFGTLISSVVTASMTLRSSDGALIVAGIPSFNTSLGAQNVSLMWLLSRYRKPRLLYTSNDIVTSEENGVAASISLIMMRDRLCRIVDRTLSLAVDANGETAADAGAAVSGLAAGLTRTANRWYFIYAVRVQYGSDADGINAIMVAHTTSPDSANIATLNTAFGTGEWVYLGVVRNGYNDGVNTNILVPFVYDESGFLRFTQATAATGLGVTLASASGTTTDLSHDIIIGNAAANTIPITATQILIGGYRGLITTYANGFIFSYRSIASGEDLMVITGCHYDGFTEGGPLALIFTEVPVISNYRIYIDVGAGASDKYITLLGVLDHYL